MTLQEQIDGLPPWADEISLGGLEEDRNYIDLMAATARLALARKWIKMVRESVTLGGEVVTFNESEQSRMDALIDALEPPK
jgi:hypothetical protein